MEQGRDTTDASPDGRVFFDAQVPWGIGRYGLLIDEVVELLIKALAAAAVVWFSWHDLLKRIRTARDGVTVPDPMKSEEQT